jgi:hypothetical protein
MSTLGCLEPAACISFSLPVFLGGVLVYYHEADCSILPARLLGGRYSAMPDLRRLLFYISMWAFSWRYSVLCLEA